MTTKNLGPAAATITWTPAMCQRCKTKVATWSFDTVITWGEGTLPIYGHYNTPGLRNQAKMTYCEDCMTSVARDYHEPFSCELDDVVEALEELAHAAVIEWSPNMCRQCKKRPAVLVSDADPLTPEEAFACEACGTACHDCCGVC